MKLGENNSFDTHLPNIHLNYSFESSAEAWKIFVLSRET